MSQNFETQYFSITEKSILLLRGRFPYREILPSAINKIELTKGTDLKRPLLSILFGCALMAAFLYLIANFSGFVPGLNPNDFSGGRRGTTFGYLVVGELFLLSLGVYSIYKALPIHPVIKFTMSSGDTESLSIDEVIKSKTMESLLDSLKNILDTKQILINRGLSI